MIEEILVKIFLFNVLINSIVYFILSLRSRYIFELFGMIVIRFFFFGVLFFIVLIGNFFVFIVLVCNC